MFLNQFVLAKVHLITSAETFAEHQHTMSLNPMPSAILNKQSGLHYIHVFLIPLFVQLHHMTSMKCFHVEIWGSAGYHITDTAWSPMLGRQIIFLLKLMKGDITLEISYKNKHIFQAKTAMQNSFL